MVRAQADDGARTRAAARPDGNALRLGPADEIRDDQEIAGEAHRDDDAELIFQALAIGLSLGLRQSLQTALQPGLGLAAELLGLAEPAFGPERRQDRLARSRHIGAALGDDDGVVHRLRQVGEQGAHLGRALEAMLGRDAPALLLADRRAFGDAEQHVMGRMHRFIGEENLIGGDERQIARIGEIQKAALDQPLGGQPMAHELDIEPAGKQPLELAQRGGGRLVLALPQQPADAPMGAAGEGDQPLGHAVEGRQRQLRRLPRLALQEGFAHQPQQIAIALLALHQQDELVGRRLQPRPLRPLPGLAAQAHLAGDDGLHAGFRSDLGELKGAEQIAAIGHRHRGHGVALAELHQLLDLDGALGQRIGRVDAQVDEIGMGHCRSIILGRRQFVTLAESRRPVRPRRACRHPGRGCGPSDRRAPDCGSPPARRGPRRARA